MPVDLNSLERILVDTTILTDPTKSVYDVHREMVYNAFELGKAIASVEEPTFTYVHILPPHPPFIWDEFGNPHTPKKFNFGRWADGDHFKHGELKYNYGYTNAVSKVDELTLDLVRDIIQNSSGPPIIIVQSDHGSGSGLWWEQPELSDLEDRFAILNAYYLPNVDTNDLPKDVTPVNTFRYVFDKYFDTEYSMLENKHYFTTWSYPYNFIDETDKIRQYQNEED